MTNLLVAAAASAIAQLPPVVVEASRMDLSNRDVPSAVHVISSKEIADAGTKNVVDLLSKCAPELHLHNLGAGNPALAEVSIRGYGENGHGRMLVLVDGERLNSPDLMMPDLSRVALSGVDKIEVLGGAQTVLHGDGASAGVLNILTEPQSYDRKSYIEAHGGSWGSTGIALGTRGGFSDEGVKYWADSSYDRSDGYRNHSQYDLWNLNGGVKKEWMNGSSLRMSGFYNDSLYELPGALTYTEWQSDPRQSHATADRYHRSTYGFGTTLRAHLSDENAVKITGNFSSRKMRSYQRGENWLSENSYDILSYRILTEWINKTEFSGFANEFILGGQYAADLLDGAQKSNTTRQSPNYERQSFDVYAQDTFHFSDRLAFQLGGRYSRAWSFNSLCEKTRRADNLYAFDAALVLNPTDDSKVYLKASRSYRNPFLDEVPGRYDARYNWVNTELLSPETGWTAEFGAEWDITDELSAGADVYHTWLEDEIFYNPVSRNNENCDSLTLRRGADAHITWERDKLAGLSLGASYVKALFDGGTFGGNAIPLVPTITVSANGRYWLWNDCYLFGGYRHQGEMYSCSDFDNENDKVSGCNVFHVGMVYEPTVVAWVKGFRFSVTVDNLLDEAYCDYVVYGTQYYPAAGRSITLAVRYAF